MKKWILAASRDGINIDFETMLHSETEPEYWECEEIASAHGCPYFTIWEVPEQ